MFTFELPSRYNREMERKKFKTHMPVGAYIGIFLIYVLYLFIGAGIDFFDIYVVDHFSPLELEFTTNITFQEREGVLYR